jgi:hypothetical protein
MRICRHCVQANLVSSMALYERYWIKFNKPVQIYRNLMEAVYSRVFYFNTRLTPNQRLEYSCDKIDFPGGTCSTWFFWRPHLNQILDMNQLEREGKIERNQGPCEAGPDLARHEPHAKPTPPDLAAIQVLLRTGLAHG